MESDSDVEEVKKILCEWKLASDTISTLNCININFVIGLFGHMEQQRVEKNNLFCYK